MIYVGIDVAKDKHDCCILDSNGEVRFSPYIHGNRRAAGPEAADMLQEA